MTHAFTEFICKLEQVSLCHVSLLKSIISRSTMDIDLILCCESWACIHLIMPTLFDNAQEWMEAVHSRQDLPIECQGTISETRFYDNLRFIQFVQSNGFSRESGHMMNYFCQHWQYDNGNKFIFRAPKYRIEFAHADEVVLSNYLTLPRVLIRKDFPPKKTIKFLLPWFRFLSQNEVGVYWDRIEQIGIYVKEDFPRATTLFSLECSLHSLNKVGIMTQQLNHQRFSFTAFDMFLAGPASLINHACSNCSNAILDFSSLQVVVNADYVLAPGRVYITYNDEPTLLQHRGISCLMCRYFNYSIIYILRFSPCTFLYLNTRYSGDVTTQSQPRSGLGLTFEPGRSAFAGLIPVVQSFIPTSSRSGGEPLCV